MNKPKLFMGGTNDGRRMSVPDLPKITVPERIEPAQYIYGTPVTRSTFTDEVYRRERLETPKSIFEFYVWERLSIEEAIEKLLSNYSPKTREES